jgi:small subunit ribosomal protein S16
VVKIRLTRKGAKSPFLEILGTYNPLKDPSEIKINTERAQYWLDRGAQPTPSVKKLLKLAGL